MNAALLKPREAPRSRKLSTLVVAPRKLSVQCSSNSGRWRARCQAKVTKRVVEILTEAEIRQVLAALSTPAATNVRNRAFFLTLLDTEIRASELLTLTLQRARLDEGYLLVLDTGKKERPVKICRDRHDGGRGDADLLVLKGLIEAGKVTSVIDGTYPLSGTPEAIGHVGDGYARGTVVIAV